jgi:CBS domain-containing protein
MTSSLHNIPAQQIMTRSLICATPDQDLNEAEALLIEHRISGLPVVDDGKLVGILSRSDLARVQVLMDSLDGQVTDQFEWTEQADGFQHPHASEFRGFRQMLADLKVKDAMRDGVITCPPDATVGQLAATMVRQHIHRIIVVEEDRPVGVVSSLDLARLLADGHEDRGGERQQNGG